MGFGIASGKRFLKVFRTWLRIFDHGVLSGYPAIWQLYGEVKVDDVRCEEKYGKVGQRFPDVSRTSKTIFRDTSKFSWKGVESVYGIGGIGCIGQEMSRD